MFRYTWLLFVFLALGCSEYDLKGDGSASGSDSGLPDLLEPGGGGEVGDPGSFSGGIVGRVCEPGGEGWVVGAYVYTTYDSTGDGVDDARAEDETDENGAYELRGIPSGREYVVTVIKGSFEATYEVLVGEGLTEVPVEECMLEPPNIAVVTGEYDHIEDIIGGMGLEYTLFNGQMGSMEYLNLLRNPELMAEFDIIFFNCGMGMDWYLLYSDEVIPNLRQFVINGGSIYNSDWAYYMIEMAFADQIDFFGDDSLYASAQVGEESSVSADVLDPAMEIIIGDDEADINFDLGQWVVMEGVNSEVDVLISADVEIYTWEGYATLANRPIAVRFEMGEGQVLYTSFHNEYAATTLDMTDILEEIILSL